MNQSSSSPNNSNGVRPDGAAVFPFFSGYMRMKNHMPTQAEPSAIPPRVITKVGNARQVTTEEVRQCTASDQPTEETTKAPTSNQAQ